MVRNGQRIHPQFFGLFDQIGDAVGAIQQAVLSVAMQMRKRASDGFSHESIPIRKRLPLGEIYRVESTDEATPNDHFGILHDPPITPKCATFTPLECDDASSLRSFPSSAWEHESSMLRILRDHVLSNGRTFLD